MTNFMKKSVYSLNGDFFNLATKQRRKGQKTKRKIPDFNLANPFLMCLNLVEI